MTKPQWFLEVVKGLAPGRRYALAPGELTIGNGPQASAFLSLADQEGPSPRRMAARQALLRLDGDRLTIRDLDSPGGTFVNRRRLFTDQELALSAGDVIQVGSIQLAVRVERENVASPPAPRPSPSAAARSNGPVAPAPAPAPAPRPVSRSAPLGAPFTFQDGTAARSWDDFLTLSAQRWAAVRDELISGRIGEHLRRTGRADLLPRREPGWTPDDVLDDWLGRLPSTRPSAPELDVHPDTVSVPAGAAGGVVRRTIRIANVGYRILRVAIAVEPATGVPDAVRLASSEAKKGRTLSVVDEAELVLEIAPPEDAFDAALGAVVIKDAGTGATRRIGVRIERPRIEHPPDVPMEVSTASAWSNVRPLGERLAGIPMVRRLWTFPLLVLALRGLVGLGNRLPIPGLEPGGDLRLLGAAAFPTLAGAILGWAVGARGGTLDGLASSFAGAVVGLFASALLFATIRSFESMLGPPALAAAALGAALALASWIAFPPETQETRP